MSYQVNRTDQRTYKNDLVEDLMIVVSDAAGKLYKKDLLKSIPFNGDGSLQMPANTFISYIIVITDDGATPMTLLIGTTLGGSEIDDGSEPIQPGVPMRINLNIYAKDILNIYFTGIQNGTVIKFVSL